MDAHEGTTVDLVLEAMHKEIRTVTKGLGDQGSDPFVDFAMAAERSIDEVQIGDIEDHRSVVTKMNSGRRKRDEDYVVVINIWTTRQNISDARKAAIAQWRAIENWLAEHPDFGLDKLPTLRCLEIESTLNMTMNQDQLGWQVHVTMRPRVEARLI